MHKKNILYRTTGVILQELTLNYVSQKDLFGNSETADKLKLIHEQIDSLESKFGKRTVYLASTQQAINNQRTGTDSDDLDRDLLFL
jgi:hypothetical protein